MRIISLNRDSKLYTSNVYLITGSRNALRDVNTLIDVGRDPLLIDAVKQASTGVGKKRVEQVVVTHSHYDHIGILPLIWEAFRPRIYALCPHIEHATHSLDDAAMLRFGDRGFRVIHFPGHSQDSVCLYCEKEAVLFSGDTPLRILSRDSTYEASFVQALAGICALEIRAIYPGHGDPILDDCGAMLRRSLESITG